jgi:GT2 family glycosyltransferase
MAVRREAFESVDGFDESFDFLDADTDFSMRLRQAGWRLGKCEDIVAYHEGGGSPQSTAKRVVRHHRNRWRLLKKHRKLDRQQGVKWLLYARHCIEYAILLLARNLLCADPKRWNDKLAGRSALLRGVWGAYDDIYL